MWFIVFVVITGGFLVLLVCGFYLMSGFRFVVWLFMLVIEVGLDGCRFVIYRLNGVDVCYLMLYDQVFGLCLWMTCWCVLLNFEFVDLLCLCLCLL